MYELKEDYEDEDKAYDIMSFAQSKRIVCITLEHIGIV